jgi:hypothetical protein
MTIVFTKITKDGCNLLVIMNKTLVWCAIWTFAYCHKDEVLDHKVLY